VLKGIDRAVLKLMKKQQIIAQMVKEYDFWEPDSEEEKVKPRFKQFTYMDMNKPAFSVGQVFNTLERPRHVIREYSCQTRRLPCL
jgi:3-hydroxy-3-methylglutaryl CoA synthase